MEHIYVLSDPDSELAQKYKIGITKRNKQYLLRDYRRSRPEVRLHYFRVVENSKHIEDLILSKYESVRVKHESGKLSEWINVDLEDLLKSINSIIVKEESSITSDESTDETLSIDSFITEGCTLFPENINLKGMINEVLPSESCKDLYNEYLYTNKDNHVGMKKMRYLNFCKELSKYLANYYKIPKKDLKYRKNKLVYYRYIQIGKVESTRSQKVSSLLRDSLEYIGLTVWKWAFGKS